MQALFSVSTSHEVSSCLPFVSKLSCFLPFCGLSYVGLITGSDIDKISNIIGGNPCCFSSQVYIFLNPLITPCSFFHTLEDEDDYTACFPYIKHGACLSGSCSFSFKEDPARLIDRF